MRVKTADLNAYMRNYMRVRCGHRPRKEPMEAARAEFQRIVRAGDYGTIAEAAERVGVTRTTGWRWLRQMLKESRSLAQGDPGGAGPQAET